MACSEHSTGWFKTYQTPPKYYQDLETCPQCLPSQCQTSYLTCLPPMSSVCPWLCRISIFKANSAVLSPAIWCYASSSSLYSFFHFLVRNHQVVFWLLWRKKLFLSPILLNSKLLGFLFTIWHLLLLSFRLSVFRQHAASIYGFVR